MKLKKLFILLITLGMVFVLFGTLSVKVSAASTLSPTTSEFKRTCVLYDLNNNQICTDISGSVKGTGYRIYKFIPEACSYGEDLYYDFYTTGSTDTIAKVYSCSVYANLNNSSSYKLEKAIDGSTKLDDYTDWNNKRSINCFGTYLCKRDYAYYFVVSSFSSTSTYKNFKVNFVLHQDKAKNIDGNIWETSNPNCNMYVELLTKEQTAALFEMITSTKDAIEYNPALYDEFCNYINESNKDQLIAKFLNTASKATSYIPYVGPIISSSFKCVALGYEITAKHYMSLAKDGDYNQSIEKFRAILVEINRASIISWTSNNGERKYYAEYGIKMIYDNEGNFISASRLMDNDPLCGIPGYLGYWAYNYTGSASTGQAPAMSGDTSSNYSLSRLQ